MSTTTPWSRLLAGTADFSTTLLEQAADQDWSLGAADSDWTCRATLDHLALGILGYAGLLIARPTDRYITLFGSLDPAAPVPDCLEGLRIATTMLASAVREATPDARAWHPWGHSDRTGFAAMGMVELLVHTHDIARALGLDGTLPDGLAGPALARLFPDAPPGHGPGETLLWSTGRTVLPDHPRKPAGRWRWHGELPRP
ncbi:maleylpyruvate isomerase N-terminal domain-containing protein [Kitasatospora sp. NPDC050543]|uniref:maleylpyruvate isomerase N-terminal domain-containing protein n=1 Tax=Kitasatospora sp. NPDC050543 TaxID=3364054 RepID=UPI003795F1FA